MTTLARWTHPGSLRADLVALRNDDADSILQRIDRLVLDRTEVRGGAGENWLDTDWSDIVVDVTDGPSSVPHFARRCSAMDERRRIEISYHLRKLDEYDTPEGRRLVVYGVEEGWSK